MYDIIIIGAGIAGLYCAYLLNKTNPSLNICILEKESVIGGRASIATFEGVRVVRGAGIGRKNKDHLLQHLLKELNVPHSEFPSKHYYAKGINHPMTKYMSILKNALGNTNPRQTFKKYATKILGKEDYDIFVTATGYSDFEKADARDVILDYNMDDNYKQFTGISIPWDKLSDSLADKIGRKNIHLTKDVLRLYEVEDHYCVVCQDYEIFEAKKIICATTIDSLRALFNDKRIYHQISGQPFLRVYAKFDEASDVILKTKVHGFTVVERPLQTIIPMDKGVYMIAYSDNASAVHLMKKTNDKQYMASKVEQALSLEKGILNILSLQSHCWSIGTHYNTPLPKIYETRKEFMYKAQRPMNNIWVVGEVVAMDQGWTEGALQSVHEIIKEI